MNPLNFFGIRSDNYSEDKKCVECGRELYTHDAEYCSRSCERKHEHT